MKKEYVVFGLLGLCVLLGLVWAVKGSSIMNGSKSDIDSIYAEVANDSLGDYEEDEEDELFKLQEDGTIIVDSKYKMTADEHGLSIILPKLDQSPYFILNFAFKAAVFTEPTLKGIKYYDEYPCYNLSDNKDTKKGVKFYTNKQELLPYCVLEKDLSQESAFNYIADSVPFEQIRKKINFTPLNSCVYLIYLVVYQDNKVTRYPIYHTNEAIFNRIISGMLHKKLYK